ncbi:MAG TPA: hypothetical protein PKL81_07575 [Ferruginibacter sp.]|nr:hypothetical protein [Ferruginibacter sp.]HNL64936.1 hypothetical protein [Ferruginibacter sp.]HNN71409.1 hypothetical protein [Ferruginibacter sp.]
MKKRFLIIFTTSSFLFLAGNATAQQSNQETKPVKAPTPAVSAPANEAPKALTLEKAAAEPNDGKAIVPGGEFKPADTRINPLANAVAPRPAVPAVPVNAPVPATKTEGKKPASTPVQQQ